MIPATTMEAVCRVFANDPGDLASIPGRVITKTLKMELDSSLLKTQQYEVRIEGKVEGKELRPPNHDIYFCRITSDFSLFENMQMCTCIYIRFTIAALIFTQLLFSNTNWFFSFL